jgi:hypothetical protein
MAMISLLRLAKLVWVEHMVCYSQYADGLSCLTSLTHPYCTCLRRYRLFDVVNAAVAILPCLQRHRHFL